MSAYCYVCLWYGSPVCMIVNPVGRAVFPIIIGDSDGTDDLIGRRESLDTKTFESFPGNAIQLTD